MACDDSYPLHLHTVLLIYLQQFSQQHVSLLDEVIEKLKENH